MSVRINEFRHEESGYGPPIRVKLVKRPGTKATGGPMPSGFFDEMATLEDEGKVQLEVLYGEQRRVIDPPPTEWREWNYDRAKGAWEAASG